MVLKSRVNSIHDLNVEVQEQNKERFVSRIIGVYRHDEQHFKSEIEKNCKLRERRFESRVNVR